jgi:RecA/RadA recombinase
MQRVHGGGAGRVIIMDTENAFRPERVAQIAENMQAAEVAARLDAETMARIERIAGPAAG